MIKTADRVCCFPLETGIKWFGYIFTGLSLLSVVINLILLMSYEEVVEESSDVGVFDLRRLLIDARTSYIIMLVSSVLSVGSSYMLVMAVNKRNRSYLLPWLVSYAISMVFWTIVLCPVLVPLFIILSPLGLIYYAVYCVYSMFIVLQTEQLNPNNMNGTAEADVISPQYAN